MGFLSGWPVNVLLLWQAEECLWEYLVSARCNKWFNPIRLHVKMITFKLIYKFISFYKFYKASLSKLQNTAFCLSEYFGLCFFTTKATTTTTVSNIYNALPLRIIINNDTLKATFWKCPFKCLDEILYFLSRKQLTYQWKNRMRWKLLTF